MPLVILLYVKVIMPSAFAVNAVAVRDLGVSPVERQASRAAAQDVLDRAGAGAG
jgi:hypothetical protein